MYRLSKKNNNKGYTLVELLGVLVIAAIISVITIGLTVSSINNYRDISAESALRDEADLILSQVYSSIYKLRESSICETPGMTSSSGVANLEYIVDPEEHKTCLSSPTNTIGLTGANEFTLFNGQVYRVLNKEITVESFNLIKKAKASYEINLTLKLNGKKLSRNFNNQVSTINDM